MSINTFSGHYSGESGNNYFEYQNRFARRSGIINARKFTPELNNPKTILDFGCGGGYMLSHLDADFKYGLEVNEIAQKEAILNGVTVFNDLTLIQDSSIDALVSNHALEHVFFPLGTLKEIYRVLGPNGRFICFLPLEDWRRQKKFREAEINNHLHGWTPQLMGNILVEAGFSFDKIKIEIISSSWFPGTKYLWKFEKLFNFLCYVYCIVRRDGKQLKVVCKK
jgi:ubiquinone/menaquinone biosynthesis C-methylase UbiE